MYFHTSQHITSSHFPIDRGDDDIRDPQSNFRLSATKSHACHAKCAFTRHKTSPLLAFPIDTPTTRLEKKQNDEQTVHHPQTPKKENKNPLLRIREKCTCISMLLLVSLSCISCKCLSRHTPHFTLHTSYYTHQTPHSTLHTS